MNNKWRHVLLITNSGLIEIPFIQLRKGDLFYLIDPDGTPVFFNQKLKLEAVSDAFVNGNGIPEIEMTDYDPAVFH